MLTCSLNSFAINMAMHLKDPNDEEARALVEWYWSMKSKEAQASKDPKNKTQMKTTDGKICKFTEPD